MKEPAFSTEFVAMMHALAYGKPTATEVRITRNFRAHHHRPKPAYGHRTYKSSTRRSAW